MVSARTPHAEPFQGAKASGLPVENGLSDVQVDVALLEIMRDALQVTLLLREVSQLPVAADERQLAHLFRKSRLAQLRCLVERSIDLIDLLEGDPDLEAEVVEEDDPAEDDESSWPEVG